MLKSCQAPEETKRVLEAKNEVVQLSLQQHSDIEKRKKK